MDEVRNAWQVSIRRACSVLRAERSSYHYKGCRTEQADLKQRIKEIAVHGGDHGFIGGFGIIANATYNKSRVTTPDGRRISFPGTSRWVYNVGPYFEKYGVSARVVYQKRTEWLSELGGPDTGGDLFWDTDGELDASIRYAITPHIEVYAEGGNLLNGPGRRYVGNKVRTLEFEKFGRRFQGGVRVTY